MKFYKLKQSERKIPRTQSINLSKKDNVPITFRLFVFFEGKRGK